MSAYNNNTTFNTNSTAGLHNQQPGQLNENHGIAATGLNTQHGVDSTGLHNQHGVNSTGLHNQQPGQLNENHGIAATGLNTQHGVNSTGRQHQGGLSGAVQDIKNVGTTNHGHGTNGITNNSKDHGYGTNGITNNSSNPLHQDQHRTGVPVPSHGNQHLNDNNAHHTGTAFAGTTATLGAVGQPDTQSRTANHLGHTGQAKTHTEIDDLASSRPRDHSRSAGAADEIAKHTINNNHGVQNSVASDARRTNDPYTTSTGSDLTGASALQSNTPGHNNHHGAGATAAAAGATALGAHEHNKHNNHHTTGTGYTGNTTGLGTQDNKHGLTDNDRHRTGAAGPAGAVAAGTAALGSHEHNKQGFTDDRHHAHGVTGTGPAGTSGLDPRDNKHGLTSNDRHRTGAAGPAGAAGAVAAGTAALGSHEHNKQGLTDDRHRAHGVTGTGPAGTSGLDPRDNKHGLTNNDHHRTGAAGAAGVAGAGAAALGAHEHNNKPGLPSDANHLTTGTGVHDHETNNVKHAGGGVSAIHGDHGASHHVKNDNHLNTSGNKGDLKLGGEEPGVHDSRGVRHAGVPLHEGLGPVHDYNQEHLNDTDNTNAIKGTTDNKPSAGDKIKGNLEKIAGKITGNEEKVIKGENIAHGRAV